MTFLKTITEGYAFQGNSLFLGMGIQKNTIVKDTRVSIPFSTMNRHGLIAGATGTGKTKTIQKMIESLSEVGVPTIVMDMKGDISGLAMPGNKDEKIRNRLESLGNPEWNATGFPCEFYSFSQGSGVQIRSTITEFGGTLFSRLLDLNDTGASVIALIFKYCDDHGLALLDLDDIKKVLQYIIQDGKEEIESEYGAVSSATVNVIMRKIIELESQGAAGFFGEPSFDTEDFLRNDDEGKGYINIIRLEDMMDRPKLFSTCMLSLLSEIYHTFPEIGESEKPKLVLIIDEAHIIFEQASETLLRELESMIKLIRSKGVGIFFCTQNPVDIPDVILSQLGLKIQHALRAFTAKDQEVIKKSSKNFPVTEYYTVEDELLTLGIGEAFVTALNEQGIPTPLVRTMIAPPESRMNTLTDVELTELLALSELIPKYNTEVNRESAEEILSSRIAEKMNTLKNSTPTQLESVGSNIAKDISRTLASELGRSLGKSIGGRTGGTIGAQIFRGLLGAVFSGK
ncbi:DUF853 family protein [Candidatus Gracilibacteria bacterium]|nr:DUF853 family protein [Candidatus Gracilibacteria bacterium]